MYKTSSKLLTAGAVTGLLLGVAACGGTGTDTDKGGESAFNAASTGIVSPSDKAGGTLNLVNSASPDHLDPARGYYAWVWDMARFYTRTLLTYPNKTGAEGLELVPDLATEAAKSPDGGQTWTYKLKDGIKFEDGAPITSKDVKYGIERTFASDVLDGGPSYLKDWLDNGQNYPGPYKDPSPDKLGLKSVETPDDKTIVFKLKGKFQDFPYILAMPFSSPVPKAKDTGAKYTLKPVSSGPYKIETYTPDKEIVFTRNPNWDKSTDSVRKALPDKIAVTLKLNPPDVDNRLLAGSADIDASSAGVQATAQSKIISQPDLKKYSDTPNSGFIRYVSIQTKVPPFDNIHCRKAVQYAVDKKALQDLHGGSVAGGDIATTMIPPTNKEHTKFDPYQTEGNRGDLAKAKDELTQCGKPNGFPTVIVARAERPKEVKQAEAIREQLKKINVNVSIQTYPAGDYTKKVVGVPATMKAKGIGLAMFGWGADYPSAYGYLSELIDGRKIKPQGNYNVAELNDPAINDAIDQAVAEPDESKRTEMWQQIDRKVMDTGVFLPFVYEKVLMYRNPRLTNVYAHQAFGFYDFQALGVQK
jgi:peptide/nickel transport system substrate-binding protein